MAEAGDDTGSAGPEPPARRDDVALRRRAAARRFQRAAVRLAWAGRKDGTCWSLDALAAAPGATHEVEAGRALVELADAGDNPSLTQFLRPDPGCPTTLWTIACYRIGDLVPDSLRDFSDPSAAVTYLADCGDPAHMAAELVASTPGGLCWVALVRTGDRLRFQLFNEQSVLERPGRHGLSEDQRGAVLSAKNRWAVVLASWSAEQGALGSTSPGAPGATRALEGADPGADLVAPTSGDDLAAAAARSGAAPERAGAEARWGAEVLVDVAITLRDLTDAVSAMSTTIARLERTITAISNRLDVVPEGAPLAAMSPSAVLGRSARGAAAATPYELAETGATDGEPRHWWWPRHRVARGLPAVGGSAGGPS